MTVSRDDVLGLVLDVHRAALEPGLWPDLISRVRDATNSNGINVYLGDRAATPLVPSHSNVEPEFLDAWLDYYWEIDPWCRRNVGGIEGRKGQLRTSRSTVPAAVLEDCECYNDLWLSRGYHDGFAANYHWNSVGDFSGVSGVRRTDRGDYSPEDLAVLGTLSSHFIQALAVDRALRGARRATTALSDALDQFATGVIVLDERGRVLRANRAARQILAANDGLSCSRDGLLAARPGLSRQLSQLVGAVMATSAGEGLAPGGAMSLERPSGGRPLSVLVSPVAEVEPELAGTEGGAIVFVSDHDSRHDIPASALSELWELTPAEARLTTRLSSGLDLAEAAAELTIEVSTARQYLKQVFAKTGTSRQSELVLVVGRALGTAATPDAG